MHGYDLAKEIEARSAGALAPGQGTLSPLLHRLEREGLIAGKWEARRSAGGTAARRTASPRSRGGGRSGRPSRG